MSNFNSQGSKNEQESDKIEADLLRHIEQTLESLEVLVEAVSPCCLAASQHTDDETLQNSEMNKTDPDVAGDDTRHNFLETTPDEDKNLENDDIPPTHQEDKILDDQSILPNDETEASGINRCVEPTVSTLAREILLRGDSCETRKTKILQLPPDLISHTCGEREIVGDDAAQTATHIFCECEQPGVSGGAVPVVTSFTMSGRDPDPNDNDQPKLDSKSSLTKKASVCSETTQSKPRPSLTTKLPNSLGNEKLDSLTQAEKSSPDLSSADTKHPRNISFKKVSLPEKQSRAQSSSGESIAKKDQNDEDDRQAGYKKLTNEFSKQISRLAEEASGLAEIKSSNAQSAAIDSLYNQIINLRKVANDLKVLQCRNASETIILDQSLNVDETQPNAEMHNKIKTKDNNNRIYIKFLPTKSVSVKKRKSCNSEVQTDFGYMLDQETLMPPNDDLGTREVDSVDGMFIPSFDDPPKMEDDDDEDGLDITITFPEMQNTVQEDNSHLSVRFSSISAEALGRLKRCPKEFTLRMDFVQGKMFFQSGKSPANNFAIGPDLKITECIIDNKQSDIINIKPSTECLYASQIITVEGESARKNSIKILRSTDSELFNVVSVPYVDKRTSVATKSCITFKNLRRVSSESLLPDRTHYKSMPQIPSLTRILEEPSVDCVVGGIRAAMIVNEKKPRNRTLQKKRTNASLENILNDAL